MFTEKQINLFWSHVDKSGECWNWIAKHTQDGYGSLKLNRKMYSAHRVAYEISTGDNPSGFVVMHSCDNKSCCNPAHLKKGTHRDNMQDMIAKGRQAKKLPNYSRKLTAESAAQLRKDFELCGNKHEVARKYNVSVCYVRQVIRRECWK
jgi:hypothetical protein